ncbi:metallophosphoesterase family protein [Romboutsia sp.]|uniref:metallophosphoesterase family protein n=1 Tax=Romboutsia sp. TaxID=1965302 RepID=UPI002CCDED5E|nr:metallophosphoesterase family protein [Romboutsia sp.]HSQ88981.1 metallophosphoesterase family protein [Romboutsia sp.]
MIIGLISDTHGLLRKEVVEKLRGCDLIIHAGDIGKIEVVEKLKDIAQTELVKGNCDKNIDSNIMPEEKIIEVRDKRIYLIHDIEKLKVDLKKENIDIVVYGHSHKKNIYTENGIIYINPGSIGPKRFKLPTTMAKLYIDEKEKNKDILTDDIFELNEYYVEFINI